MLVLRLWKIAFTFYLVFCKSALSERKKERERERERLPDTVWSRNVAWTSRRGKVF